jgi:3-hydroxybutyrate dehydrogenase
MTKSAIITGGASGIGASIAESFCREGHNVVIADMNEDQGPEVAKAIGATFFKTNLADQAACRSLINHAAEKFRRIDILVNNAGFQHVSPLEEFPEDKWHEMISVMLTAPFLLTRYVWPYMKNRKWGRVVNMASIHGMVASPNKIGYISAKHGLIGLTRAAAIEGGEHGITVNALCPAYVRTPLVENQIGDQARTLNINKEAVVEQVLLKSAAIKRLIEPEEIAGLVSYLCSDKAGSITGACWTIDCGWTAQ